MQRRLAVVAQPYVRQLPTYGGFLWRWHVDRRQGRAERPTLNLGLELVLYRYRQVALPGRQQELSQALQLQLLTTAQPGRRQCLKMMSMSGWLCYMH